MKYEIYQIRDIENVDYAFRGYNVNKFSIKDYEKVYCGNAKKEALQKILRDLFFMFNCNPPKDFKGRSLSVSDIVVIDGNRYYCDLFGWKKIA